MDKVKFTEKYLKYRDNVLKYTNIDMNLELENDEQVYIAVFDIPTESGILFGHTKTLALVFGLNTHIYFGNGDVIVGLEKNKYIMKAMQSLFISSPQVLKTMQLVNDFSYYESSNVRAYLKTGKGMYFKELTKKSREEKFLNMLMENVLLLFQDIYKFRRYGIIENHLIIIWFAMIVQGKIIRERIVKLEFRRSGRNQVL